MEKLISSDPEHGFRLNFGPSPSEIAHKFCGTDEIKGAGCPNCFKPLLRILSLAADDPRLNLNSSRLRSIHLLYCWTCSIPFGIFSYRIAEDGSVEVLGLPPAYEYAFGSDGPYDGYTGLFPLKRVGLIPLTEDEQRQQMAARSDGVASKFSIQDHQIGGFPAIANPERIVCPVCSSESPLLAVISDDASGNPSTRVKVPAEESFTDNAGTQMAFHFCRNCSVVSAYHSND
jgi:hypothetical protein